MLENDGAPSALTPVGRLRFRSGTDGSGRETTLTGSHQERWRRERALGTESIIGLMILTLGLALLAAALARRNAKLKAPPDGGASMRDFFCRPFDREVAASRCPLAAQVSLTISPARSCRPARAES